MFFKNNLVLIFLFLYFLSSLEFNTSLSEQSRRSLHVSSSSDAPQTPAWIDPNRTYFSHYISHAKWRISGTCWKAPLNAPKIAIVAIFKNEAQGLREWLDHYTWQGFDSILLLDNGSSDNWKPIVQEYNQVTVRDAPLLYHQKQYYEESFSWLYDKKIEIAIFADLDEYIFSLDGRSLQEILLEFFFDPATADISELFIPWSMFGSSGQVGHPVSIREAFTWRRRDGPGVQYTNGKTFFRVKDVSSADIHVPRIRDGVLVYAGDRFEGEVFADMLDPNWVDSSTSGPPLQLNHYLVQSEEFYKTVKMKRGAADVPEHYDLRTWEYFREHDYHDVEDKFLKDYIADAGKNGTLHGFHCKGK